MILGDDFVDHAEAGAGAGVPDGDKLAVPPVQVVMVMVPCRSMVWTALTRRSMKTWQSCRAWQRMGGSSPQFLITSALYFNSFQPMERASSKH